MEEPGSKNEDFAITMAPATATFDDRLAGIVPVSEPGSSVPREFQASLSRFEPSRTDETFISWVLSTVERICSSQA